MDGFFQREVSPGIVQWVIGMMLSASPLGAAACLRADAATDFGPELSAFTVRTLVIAADADESCPMELAGCPTAAAIAGSQLVVISGAGHAMFFTEHERLNQELLAFRGS